MSVDTEQKLPQSALLRMTTDVVSAYVGHNTLPAGQIGDVICSVYGTLEGLHGNGRSTAPDRLKPAVPVRRSVTPDYLICLEDGKKLKMLKRHLRTNYSMTPDEYRAKWGLGPDYPMVAPSYSTQRSRFAKKIGLGRAPKPAAE